MSPKLARIARILGVLSIILGLVAVVGNAVQGESLLGPGWIAVLIGAVVILLTRTAARSTV